MTSTTTAIKTIVPCTFSRSRDPTSRTSICPTPGNVKTRSITTTPAMRLATCTPRIDTIGKEALRSPWRHSAWVLVKPFARAVRMYLVQHVERRRRTKRNRIADWARARVSVGNTSAR